MYIVGFTGTKDGTTTKQKEKIRDRLILIDPVEAHHGDYIGADTDFHNICLELGIDIIIHPPINDSKRAFNKDYKLCHKPKKYLDRNRDIVDQSQIMFATPKTREEEIRSGTWFTIRYTKKKKKRLFIIYP